MRSSLKPYRIATPETEDHQAWNWALQHRPDLAERYIRSRSFYHELNAIQSPTPAGSRAKAILEDIISAWRASKETD